MPLAEDSDAGGNLEHKLIFPVGPDADDEPPLDEALDPPGLLPDESEPPEGATDAVTDAATDVGGAERRTEAAAAAADDVLVAAATTVDVDAVEVLEQAEKVNAATKRPTARKVILILMASAEQGRVTAE